MLNIGIIGCGKIAQVRHIPEYNNNPDAHIVAFYDYDHARAQQMAQQFGGRACDSVEELLAMPEIDAVSICTPNTFHAQMTIQALNAGKHVLCEKPMATTLEDCEAMVAAAKKNRRYLMIGHNQRLAGAHVKARELVGEGAIGKILTFRTIFGHGGPETWSITPGRNVWFFDRKRAAMGAMADLGVHKTDLISYLTGERIIAATARLDTLDKTCPDGTPIDVDDNAICIYELTGHILGTMTASWTYYGAEDNSTVLYGTKGILRIYDNPEHSIVLIHSDGTREYFDTDQIQTNDHQTSSGIIDQWIACLRDHREPEISGESALRAMRAVFAAIRSSAEGKRIEIPENRE